MMFEARGVVAGYGKVTILHGVDIHIQEGEIVVLFGRNGAGKSTLVKTIAGHLPVSDGELLFEGGSIAGRTAAEIARSGIGYVPQERNIFGDMTVLENLQISARGSKSQIGSAIDSTFARFPILSERSRQRASTLSGGERQMLAISSALMTDPKMLVLDEPTSGLAPVFVQAMVEWIASLVKEQGKGVVWVVEQNPLPILAVSERTYTLEGGRVVNERRSEELRDEAVLTMALLDEAAPAEEGD